MRKERDWVVPVRGCQSSVSSISLFLLRSLGIKQGMLSTLRPCLPRTHTPNSSSRSRSTQQVWLTQSHPGTTHSHKCMEERLVSESRNNSTNGHPLLRFLMGDTAEARKRKILITVIRISARKATSLQYLALCEEEKKKKAKRRGIYFS